MEDFDKDPLDLLDDDGDGLIEMGLIFDEDEKSKKPSGNSGCCVVLCAGASLAMAGWGLTKLVI